MNFNKLKAFVALATVTTLNSCGGSSIDKTHIANPNRSIEIVNEFMGDENRNNQTVSYNTYEKKLKKIERELKVAQEKINKYENRNNQVQLSKFHRPTGDPLSKLLKFSKLSREKREEILKKSSGKVFDKFNNGLNDTVVVVGEFGDKVLWKNIEEYKIDEKAQRIWVRIKSNGEYQDWKEIGKGAYFKTKEFLLKHLGN